MRQSARSVPLIIARACALATLFTLPAKAAQVDLEGLYAPIESHPEQTRQSGQANPTAETSAEETPGIPIPVRTAQPTNHHTYTTKDDTSGYNAPLPRHHQPSFPEYGYYPQHDPTLREYEYGSLQQGNSQQHFHEYGFYPQHTRPGYGHTPPRHPPRGYPVQLHPEYGITPPGYPEFAYPPGIPVQGYPQHQYPPSSLPGHSGYPPGQGSLAPAPQIDTSLTAIPSGSNGPGADEPPPLEYRITTTMIDPPATQKPTPEAAAADEKHATRSATKLRAKHANSAHFDPSIDLPAPTAGPGDAPLPAANDRRGAKTPAETTLPPAPEGPYRSLMRKTPTRAAAAISASAVATPATELDTSKSSASIKTPAAGNVPGTKSAQLNSLPPPDGPYKSTDSSAKPPPPGLLPPPNGPYQPVTTAADTTLDPSVTLPAPAAGGSPSKSLMQRARERVESILNLEDESPGAKE